MWNPNCGWWSCSCGATSSGVPGPMGPPGVPGPAGNPGFIPATSNMTFYVATNGFDANNGLTAATAFATLQHAVNVACTGYNWQNLYKPTIQILDGIYSAGALAVTVPPMLNAALLTIKGSPSRAPVNLVTPDFFTVQVGANQMVNFVGAFTFSSGFVCVVLSGTAQWGITTTDTGTILNIGGASGWCWKVSSVSGLVGPTGVQLVVTDLTMNFTGTGFNTFIYNNNGVVQFVNTFNNFPATAFTETYYARLGDAARTRFHDHRYTNFASVTGNRLNAVRGSALLTPAGLEYLPGTADGLIDSDVEIFSDAVNLTSRYAKRVTTPPLPTNATYDSGVGNVMPYCWDVLKDTSNGRRWLAMHENAGLTGPGQVYAIQIGKYVNTQTGAAYTLALTDQDGILEMNNAAANTVTVPPNSTVALPLGTKISVVQAGAGVTTIAAGAGVTVRSVGAIAGGQWKSALLYQRAANDWVQLNGAF